MKFPSTVAFLTCVLFGFCASAFTARAQESGEFRTVFGGFGVKLPNKYSEYKPALLQIANYKFPTRIYHWNFEHEIFTISSGEGTNDLEKPEYAKLFLDDFRRQYAGTSLKQNGVIIDESKWSYEGHPGWQMVERHNGIVVNLRFFVIGDRFYSISVAVNDGLGINEARQNILDSFHLLLPAEYAEEKERLIQTFSPPPLPQQPAIKRPVSDAQEENLRGNVKRVYTEEGEFLGRPEPITIYPRTREDFDQNGYLVSKIQFLDFMPYKAFSFGYVDGARAYLLTERPSLVEQVFSTGPKTPQPPQLYKVEYKYGKTGQLEEVRASAEKGKLEQVYSYHDKTDRREIGFKERGRFDPEISLRWKSVIQLDKDGNTTGETRTEYVTSPTGRSITLEKQIDSYSIVADAIRGQAMISPNGNTKPPSVADVVKNPNLTQSVTQPTGETGSRPMIESTYSYTYDFDSHGNWIKRIQSLIKKADRSTAVVPVRVTVTYRKITYY